MKHDLIDRYIYAVVRHLPQKQRAEVELELQSLISDMLDERCGEILPADKDVRVVLTELGTPDELAAKYSGEEKKSLISGVYFITYKRVLKLVLPIVAGAVLLGTVISVLSNPSENLNLFALRLIAQPIGGIMAGVFQAFAVITFIFAALEHFKADLSGDYLSDLPMVPKQIQRIKPYEPIIGIFWSITATVLFLGFPQIMGGWFDGVWIPVFDVALLRSLWLPIILWTVLGIAQEIVTLTEGQYTKKLAIVTLTVNAAILVCAAVVFLNRSLINPEFVRSFAELFPENSALISRFAGTPGVLLFVLICIGVTIESVTVAVKARRMNPAVA